MKVLQVMAGGEHGGAETMFADSVTALHGAGVTQRIVSRPSPMRDALWHRLGIPVRHARFPSLFGFPTAAAIAGEIAAFKPDVAHFWMGRAAMYARKGHVPNLGWFGGYYDLKYYRQCDYFVGVSHDIVRHIVAAGAPADRTFTVHTFADLEPAPPVDRARHDTPRSAPLLLGLGRLHWKKGFDLLLQSLADIPQAWLWLAGEGPLRAELEAKAAQLGIADRVRFLGWRTDRAALLAASDLCVFPSRYEPFGTVMVEAWACGVPLIATAAAGPKAYVEPGVNGLLLEIDDQQALTDAIRLCLADSDLCRRLVEGGRRTYRTMFTKEVLIRDFLRVYERAALGALMR